MGNAGRKFNLLVLVGSFRVVAVLNYSEGILFFCLLSNTAYYKIVGNRERVGLTTPLKVAMILLRIIRGMSTRAIVALVANSPYNKELC